MNEFMIERTTLAIQDGQLSISQLRAITESGNLFTCGVAMAIGLSFEAWLRWTRLPNATRNAERFVSRLLSELITSGYC